MRLKIRDFAWLSLCLPVFYALSIHKEPNKENSFIKNESWEHFVVMDGNGLYFFEWWTDSKDIHFRVTVNTQGCIGLGFSKKSVSPEDFLLIWVDDHSGKPHILDCHLGDNKQLIQDDTQNYIVSDGFQNATHTQVEFYRELETCDPHDLKLGTDTLTVTWAFDSKDPVNGNLRYPGKKKGSGPINFLSPLTRKPIKSTQWDVFIKNINIEANMDTLYWCKIFKIPDLPSKHHIIGYEPLLTKTSKDHQSLVHHMTLYECSRNSYLSFDTSSWDVWVKSDGAVCNSNSMTPRDWDSCITPVATWSVGASGQFLPSHVGIPIGGDNHGKYYMLEIHYDNPNSIKSHDRSGFRIHYTDELRANDGGIMITGVSISDTQLIPPGQKLYKTVGICAPSCTNVMFPEAGIKVVSATTHTHKAGRKMMLRHVRDNKEMDKIIEDDSYNYNYQQVRQLVNETLIMPGDYIIAECGYETTTRKRITFGGYSTKEEMCLSFLTYYPRTQLTGCYSMTPVREFFETFGVYEFYSLNMNDVENLFLYNGNIMDLLPNSIVGETHLTKFNSSKSKTSQMYTDEESFLDQESLLNKLIISEPIEFHDRTFLSHLNQLPWSEPLFTKRVEQIMITGKHVTFCRLSNDSISIPSEIIRYPNFTAYHKPPELCPYHFSRDESGSILVNQLLMLSLLILTTFLT